MHAEERVLIVRVTTLACSCLVIGGHAPHGADECGKAAVDFWLGLTTKVMSVVREGDQIVSLMDANAHACDGESSRAEVWNAFQQFNNMCGLILARCSGDDHVRSFPLTFASWWDSSMSTCDYIAVS